ncbi:alpha/beta hydrolase [Mycoplasmatota bacterium]|nr:alpha/beta hydrolase [Mycoplasmatota bacterium]
MSFFELDGKKVYYEVHGTGKPILLLNGIMMSTLSWKLFLNAFKGNQIILVDFFDQGNSEKLIDEDYKQDLQVELVYNLIKHLKLDKINVVGISYGGEVALQFAVKYQAYIDKLIVFNTASYTSPWLEDIGRGWIATAETNDANAFYKVTIPVIYSPDFYTKNIDWMKNREKLLHQVFKKPFLDAMIRLIKSAEGYDVRNVLNTIFIPTLLVGAENDYLTPLPEQRFLHTEITNSKLVIIPGCGHASMYENPTVFICLINGFVNSDTTVSVLI